MDEIVRRVEVGTVIFRPPASTLYAHRPFDSRQQLRSQRDLRKSEPCNSRPLPATQKGSQVAERNSHTVGARDGTAPHRRCCATLDFEG